MEVSSSQSKYAGLAAYIPGLATIDDCFGGTNVPREQGTNPPDGGGLTEGMAA